VWAKRRGISIVELLIAMTISLVVLYALMWQFNVRAGQVAEARASVELLSQLRGTTRALHQDLRRVTAQARPWATTSSADGYIELIEGWGYDTGQLSTIINGAFADIAATNMLFGDFDDVVAMTIRSEGAPFVGFYLDTSGLTPVRRALDSHYAEVIWWTVWNDTNQDNQPEVGEIALYRRLLLIRPDLGTVFSQTAPVNSLSSLWSSLKLFYDSTDISTHPVVNVSGGNVTVQLVANSLADLTKRENRFCHHPILAFDNAAGSYSLFTPTYPFDMARGRVGTVDLLPALNTVVKAGDRAGEDVIQGNLLAFDMKVYDPNAPIISSSSGGDALSPNDPGFGRPGTGPGAISAGEFVDLFYMRYVEPRVSGTPAWAISEPTRVYPFAQYRSHFSAPPAFYDLNNNGRWDVGEPMRGPTVPTYDSWSFHYEQDGINQDSALAAVWPWRAAVDQGANGVDDDGARGVDDPEERETAPPYTEPLRGVKISLRVIEPGSRVVRQASVIQDFVPY
jgi:type II secretory pathway pseudopilin PulG